MLSVDTIRYVWITSKQTQETLLFSAFFGPSDGTTSACFYQDTIGEGGGGMEWARNKYKLDQSLSHGVMSCPLHPPQLLGIHRAQCDAVVIVTLVSVAA